MITFKQLEAFYWSAELSGFEAAAGRLHTTQSAISKRLQELESALGFVLFDRTRRKAQLTPRGEELRKLAWEVLSLRNRITDLGRAQATQPRTVRLGVTELTALTWLPKLVQRVRSSHPHVTLVPSVDSSAHLASQLAQGQLDLIVVPDAFRNDALEVVPLDSVEYAWLCSPEYIPDVDKMPLQSLAQYTVIEQSYSSGLGDLMGHWLQEQDAPLHNTLAASSLSAAASLTLAGVGLCYLPRRMFDHFIQSERLRVIRSTPAIPRIPYVAHYQKAQADELLKYVTAVATETCDFTSSQTVGARTA